MCAARCPGAACASSDIELPGIGGGSSTLNAYRVSMARIDTAETAPLAIVGYGSAPVADAQPTVY